MLFYLDLKRYILALSGHAHNSCAEKGCISNQCSNSGTSLTSYAYCTYSYYYRYYGLSECNLYGCVPGSYCNNDNFCLECDKQCKGCSGSGYKECKSCYITSMNNLWKYHHRASFTGFCPFEFYVNGIMHCVFFCLRLLLVSF